VIQSIIFGESLEHINRLNNGDESVEQVLDNIGRILKDTTLFNRLRDLVEQATHEED
jgi:hypothetical protein